ncbi:WYL domain-containing protein [Clostridium sp. BL-8]|uniref:helix-turn-helix transcriptional regulator n=1 Tax=Clostridium sp. BL-8 TaxID=349938 RepID=UPI0009C92272|nr:WYL domain-containing protein [Clostridium sp. BL-8]OOM78805.1 hypothetical protein CLOBL_20530 [Clostridium sp. BL-8]
MGNKLGCKKARIVVETFFLIKSGQATTKSELSDALGTKIDNIENYIEELNMDFGTDIYLKRRAGDNQEGKYFVRDDGILGNLKRNNTITADDVMIILSSLIQSQSFMENKMSIIKNNLLDFLPKNEGEKLKEMLHFEKRKNHSDDDIKDNMEQIRKSIADEKKIIFMYKNSEGKFKRHRVTPYSFASNLGMFYIIAKSEEWDSLSHFRIDRMREVKILDEEGIKEEKFNVNNYLKKTWNMYGGSETKVLVKFKDGCKTVVTERNMVEGRMVEEDKDYFIYEFICNGTKGIKLWIMGFGGDAEVLEPVELREEIKEMAENMIKTYMK